MKKSARNEDIRNRFSLALAERGLYEKGSKHYEQLSEVIRIIMSEYKIQDARGKKNRYGFRLRGSDYTLVLLEESEKI